jgi:hypothetical protein
MTKSRFAVTVFAAFLAAMPIIGFAQNEDETEADSLYTQGFVDGQNRLLTAANSGIDGRRLDYIIADDGTCALNDLDGLLFTVSANCGAYLSKYTRYVAYGGKVGVSYRFRKGEVGGTIGAARHEYGCLSALEVQGKPYVSFSVDLEGSYRIVDWGAYKQHSFSVGVVVGCTTEKMYYTSKNLDFGQTAGVLYCGGQLAFESCLVNSRVSFKVATYGHYKREPGPGFNGDGGEVGLLFNLGINLNKRWKAGSKATYRELEKINQDRQKILDEAESSSKSNNEDEEEETFE